MGNFFKNIGDALTSGISNVVAGLGQGKVDPLSVGLSAASGLFSSLGQDRANKQYMDQQLALMDKQQAFTREMFDLQQQANKSSIIDQFNQYRSLGINPLSVSGGLSQANVSAPSAPSAPSPQYQSPLEVAQIDLAKSQTAKNYAEANAIDPEEARSRTNLNNANAGLSVSKTKTEDGMREVLIQDVSAGIAVKVQGVKTSAKEEQRLTELVNVLKAQKQEAEANAKLLNEKAVTEVFNRVQQELMNKAQIEHWNNQDKAVMIQANAAMKQVALGFARLEFEKQQWQEAGLDVQKKQSEYLSNLAQSIERDTELKDINLAYESGVFDLRFKAGNAMLRAQISQAENGELRYSLDNDYIKKHNGMILNTRLIQDVNSMLGSYLTGNPIFQYGKEVLPVVGGAVSPVKGFNGGTGWTPNNYRSQ